MRILDQDAPKYPLHPMIERFDPERQAMQSKLIPMHFKVTNYRNIDESAWIKFEKVTALVGRNESGKTSLLKALHKFNPATPEPYHRQREFPRDRYNREFKVGSDWPVCSVEFALEPNFRAMLKTNLGTEIPSKAICTRFYDGSIEVTYDNVVSDNPVLPRELDKALDIMLRELVHEVIQTIKNILKVDWTNREVVIVAVRAAIKRTLMRRKLRPEVLDPSLFRLKHYILNGL